MVTFALIMAVEPSDFKTKPDSLSVPSFTIHAALTNKPPGIRQALRGAL